MNKKYTSLALAVLGTISLLLWTIVIWINTPLLGGVEGGIRSLPGPVIGFLLGIPILFSLAVFLVVCYKAIHETETDPLFRIFAPFVAGVYSTLLIAIAFHEGWSEPNFGLLLWWGGLTISVLYGICGWVSWDLDRKSEKKALES